MRRPKEWIRSLLDACGYRVQRHGYTGNNLPVLPYVVRSLVRPGFFVFQVGANDGVSGDPVYEAIRAHDVAGVFVEPQPAVFERLQATYADRPQCKLENCAVAEQDGTRTLWSIRQGPGVPEDTNQWATFDRSTLEKHVARWGRGLDLVIEGAAVPCCSLTTLFQRHQISAIDLFQVDVEGFDLQVLEMLFATSQRPGVVNFECVHLSPAGFRRSVQLLRDHGYEYCWSDRDMTAVRVS